MKAELYFNPAVLDDEMQIRYLASVVTVEREDNRVTFAPNSKALHVIESHLETIGIDNKDVRQAILAFRVMVVMSSLMSDLAVSLGERFLQKTIKKHEHDIDSETYVNKLSEFLSGAVDGEIIERMINMAKDHE
jgi:hypothetical protein